VNKEILKTNTIKWCPYIYKIVKIKLVLLQEDEISEDILISSAKLIIFLNIINYYGGSNFDHLIFSRALLKKYKKNKILLIVVGKWLFNTSRKFNISWKSFGVMHELKFRFRAI
jgi:hypothetical protein